MEKISVYNKDGVSFIHNGLVLPDAVFCTVEEELNGKYVLELTHPIDEKGKWEYLVEENIIKADGQLFRIHSTEKNLSYVYVYARHIFYDLLHNMLEDVRPTNINGSGALNWILSNTQYPHNFVGMSDIDTLNTQYYIRKNPVEAMLGADSLVTRWNGELVRDNFNIKLLASRGTNKGAHIAYGKNLLGLEVKRDMDSVVTRIMPVGRDGLLLPEKYIDSPLISNYAFPRIAKVEFDIGVDETTTEAQAFVLMRKACNDLYAINKIDIPYININADLLMLENTEEYKHLKNLVKVDLGDIVSCTDNPLNITFEAKVIRIKKDVLSNRNVEVELGQFKKGISDTLNNAIKDISEELQHSTSDLQKAIDNATELLTNALGGYVVKRPGEILIMDTEDINTATQIWRWNLNGLGYSNNGINGPYEVAMTMDGKINANFITTGTLSAGIIKTGVFSSNDNSTWINMDNGEFNFKDALKWVDGKLSITSPDIPEPFDPSGILEQLDGKIETWYQSTDPALSWVAAGEKAKHNGDMWYNTSTKKLQRYSGTAWVAMDDQTAINALDIANKKKTIFISTPTIPYAVGDLWKVTGVAGVDFKICTTARTTGNYVASDWTNITDSKNYADAIKNLTTGTAISGGITTIDNTKVKVAHSGLGGQYSEMRADGFVRKWEHGEAKYLNDIWVELFDEMGDDFGSSKPDPYMISLPERFRGRLDTKVFVVPYSFRMNKGYMYAMDDIDELVTHFRVTGAIAYDRATRAELKDLNASPPWVKLDVWQRVSWDEQYGSSNSRSYTEYSGIEYAVIAIGE